VSNNSSKIKFMNIKFTYMRQVLGLN